MKTFDETKFSKFLSLVLRHSPEAVDITLDQNGWVDINILRKAFVYRGWKVSVEQIEQIVANDNKQRYSILNGKIRANQGHSVNIDLQLPAIVPPDTLYHGTVKASLDQIFKTGIRPMSRQFAHLSGDVGTATTVGSRRGDPIILKIDAKRCHEDGFEFFCSENKVWLSKHIPSEYISFYTQEKE